MVHVNNFDPEKAYNSLPLLPPNNEKYETIKLWKQESAASCLLYTSPSPRDVEEYRMPSSA